MYKITNNLLDINPNQCLKPGHSQTRSNHPHKYRQISTSHNYYKYSFFPQTIAPWNRLPSNAFIPNNLDAFSCALQHQLCIDLTTAPFKYLPYTTQHHHPSPSTPCPYHTPTISQH
ncbi:hypothetical protein NP493_115g01012 [Ridgeia piscesae]|uniref:Uncharacterized protein n=1 Tax=Ridgeia piscesae TaxID=27915 RepID=A0AAD9P6H8_RIDPI|nr:hypothetical protein NP493_115g01012 [Ridgeia piscesae]